MVFWVDIGLAKREGLMFYQPRSHAIILQGTLPAYCIPKVESLKLEKFCMKDHTCLLDHHQRSHGDTITLGPEEKQPVGKLVQQSFGEAPRVKLSKPTQSKPNPICDRSGKLEDTERVFVVKGKNVPFTRDR